MSTQTPPLVPLRFEPILKRLIWGGRRLGTVLGKPIGPEEDYAECWELSDHRNGQSVVDGGPFAGRTLHELVAERRDELLGPLVGTCEQFPLLIKFIDARDVLSVQVHPDDEGGRRLCDDNGKNEAWVVVAADPGSRIYAGLKDGVTRPEFARALEEGRVVELLHAFEPRPGDCIDIPAGTVHAIGAGVMLAEVQQMSDATFRVYDWDRVGPDGRPRELHIDQALQSIDYTAGPVDPVRSQALFIEGGKREPLVQSPFFHLDRLSLTGPSRIGDPAGERFTALVGLGGGAVARHGGVDYPLGLGQTLLLPASVGAVEVVPAGEGGAVLLSCLVP